MTRCGKNRPKSSPTFCWVRGAGCGLLSATSCGHRQSRFVGQRKMLLAHLISLFTPVIFLSVLVFSTVAAVVVFVGGTVGYFVVIIVVRLTTLPFKLLPPQLRFPFLIVSQLMTRLYHLINQCIFYIIF